jgi:type I restriction enzyme, S subunit
MELRAGFKQTEVGAIPEEWGYHPLAHLTDPMRPIGYGIVQTGKPVRNGVKCIRVVDIVDGLINTDNLITTTHEISHAYKRTLLRNGDLIIALRGKIGAVAVVDEALVGTNLTRGVALLSASADFNSRYLSQYLSSPSGKSIIEKNLNGSALQEIPIAALRKVHAVVPPLPEQRAIAAALSEADALIASLDALIAKKRDLKQAAMQQLLTGKTRLPGFKGRWILVALGDRGSFTKGRGIRRDQVRSEGLPCVRYGEIYTHHQDIVREYNSFISQDVAVESQRLKKGDPLFTGSGETADEIGKCVAIVGSEEAYAGGDIVIFSPRTDDSVFLGYLMNHASIVLQKARMAQGDAVVHISARNLVTISFDLPDPDEQAAIAAVLSDMDADLAALESKRDKARALKQGMMQELLTGRIRLV